MKANNTSRLVAADERGLPITVLIAGVLVVSFDYALHALVDPNAWTHDFFFKRGFVQWVLLAAFAVGLVHLVRRLPPWWRERRALGLLNTDSSRLTSETLVGRRWIQIQAACSEIGCENLGQYAKSLADHDEAEVDAAYRLSGDVVQILPLMGFFGTVFGLSHGLYRSFLATGGTNTKDFAKAIAIAFDNTLLGLALTIILFALQSILRKREEAILLQLNLLSNDAVAKAVQRPVEEDPLEASIKGLTSTMTTHQATMKSHEAELEKSRKVLESPSDGLKEIILAQTTAVAKSSLQEIARLQKADFERIAQLLSENVEQAKKLSELIDQRTTKLPELAISSTSGLEALKSELLAIFKAIQAVSNQIGEITRNPTSPQLEELKTTLVSLSTGLTQRDSTLLDYLKSLDQVTSKVDALVAETHSTAQAVAGFGTRLDAVPEERRTVEGLAASIKELAHALAQRDSLMLNNLQNSLATHSKELKTEIRQPRTIRFVESPHLRDGDGETHQQ